MTESQNQVKREYILATMQAEDVGFVNLEFTDVVGMAKCVTIPAEQLPDCLIHGKWFDGSAIEGFARVAESDMYLFPDLDTFSILPGKIRPLEISSLALNEQEDRFLEEGAVARIICNVYTPNGERFDGDPRATLIHALDLADSMGFKFLVAPELEFFLLH